MNRFSRRTKWLAGGVLASAIVAGGAGLAMAGSTDDDQPLTGTDLDRASQAALDYTGGGTVIESEFGDDGAAYGVEIRKDDGSVVEVSLDADFNVIGDEADDDGPAGDDDGPSDD
jgi:hypothetical protein